jgi:hypothetical protein
MSTPRPDVSPDMPKPHVNAGRLWAGGASTALVAALVAAVGVLIAEGVLDLSMVEPPLLLSTETDFWLRYAVTAALLALAATGLAHLLAVTTPRPRAFFSWIVGLATAVGVALPFALDGTIEGQVATAAVNLVLGLCILTLLASVMARTVTYPMRPGPRPHRSDPDW